jgi:hypothetical protein
MNTLKIYFEDMWGYDTYQFNPHDNYFINLFKQHYNVVIDPNPDILIYSVFGSNNKRYNCKKIFFCGENIGHNFKHPKDEPCDVSLSQFDERDKNVYFPLWVLFTNWFRQTQPRPLPSNPTYHCEVTDLINPGKIEKTKFCAFINNNPIEDRLKIFKLLSKYKKVDSYGGLNNNVNGPIRGSEQAKILTLKDYKFTIAFENSYHPGYNTEKIIQPLSVNTIPLYKGGERMKEFFNINKIIYANNFNTLEEMADYIIELDKNNTEFNKIMEHTGVKNEFFNFMPSNVLAKICCLLKL